MGDADALKRARNARQGAQSWLTIAKNALDGFITVDNHGRGATIDVSELDDAIKEFNLRLDGFDHAQTEVQMHLDDPDEIDADIAIIGVLRDNAKRIKLKATNLYTKLTKKDNAINDDVSSNSGSNDRNVKLPKIDLKKFDGKDVKKWKPWWEPYEVSVHLNSDLANVQKFSYLSILVIDDAERAIGGLAMTADNYQKAIDILKRRFGRTELIIFAHIQGLLDLPRPCQNAEISSLHEFEDELLGHIRSLESLDIKGETYGVFLTPIILSRLPSDIRLEWARDSDLKEGDLTHLLEFLCREIERRERSKVFDTSENTKNVEDSKVTTESRSNSSGFRQQRLRLRRPAASALAAGRPNIRCGFCKEDHPSDRCWDTLRKSASERRKLVSELKLCFCCHSDDHYSNDCTARCQECGAKHHVSLCWKFDDPKGQKENALVRERSSIQKEKKTPETPSQAQLYVNLQKNENETTEVVDCIVLPTAKVMVQGELGSMVCTLLFDCAADRSYISSEVVKKIQPTWVSCENVSYAPFEGGTSQGKPCNKYSVILSGAKTRKNGKHPLCATEVPKICAPLARPSVPLCLLQTMTDIDFADEYSSVKETMKIDILIGLDWKWKFMKAEVLPKTVPDAPNLVAQDTHFGWVLSGTAGNEGLSNTVSPQMICLTDDIPESAIRLLWDLRCMGIEVDDEAKDDPVLQEFNSTICFDDVESRYEVRVPRKRGVGVPKLMNNVQFAKRHLARLMVKLDKDPVMKKRYNDVLEEWDALGVIEEVPIEKEKDPDAHYLTHRPVVRETSTTTKVRPVYNASLEGPNGVSLNDCLHAGPNLLPKLIDLLFRWRRWKVALTADIVKAFLQMKTHPDDQDIQRFLWIKDGVLRIMKFLRVTFGVNCSPFLLNATIKYHFN